MSKELEESFDRHPAGSRINPEFDQDAIKANVKNVKNNLEEWMREVRSGDIVEINSNNEITVSNGTNESQLRVTPERRKLAEKRLRNVIKNLTAPPETVRQHLDRIGVLWNEKTIGGQGVIMIDTEDLNLKEGGA